MVIAMMMLQQWFYRYITIHISLTKLYAYMKNSWIANKKNNFNVCSLYQESLLFILVKNLGKNQNTKQMIIQPASNNSKPKPDE